jgi:hypothetical protein
MPETKKKCPECGVEIEGTPEECAKCHFPLEGYGIFSRLFKAGIKELQEEEKTRQPPPKPSAMDLILGKKKKA